MLGQNVNYAFCYQEIELKQRERERESYLDYFVIKKQN